MSTAGGLLRSGRAATAAQIVRILALQATHIYVRRHVLPAEMGIWNWLEPLFLLLATLRDLGFPSHVVRLRPWPLGTLARVELVWGAVLGAAVWTGAPRIAQLFSEPGPALVAGIRVLVVFFLLEGLAAISLIWFEANLRIERTFAAELARTFVYCGVVLAAAVRGAGFWSFVIAQIASQAVYAGGLWLLARREIDLHHEPGTVLPMLRSSLPIAGIWFLAMAVTYADFFVVGRLFDRHALGLYAFGYGYAFLVTRILQLPIGRSLYPALVAFGAERHEQFRAYRLATGALSRHRGAGGLLPRANAQLATLLLAGREYLDAAPFLALLAFAPIVDPLGRFGGELLVSRRHDAARFTSLALQLAGLVGGGIALSLALGSPFGMACGKLSSSRLSGRALRALARRRPAGDPPPGARARRGLSRSADSVRAGAGRDPATTTGCGSPPRPSPARSRSPGSGAAIAPSSRPSSAESLPPEPRSVAQVGRRQAARQPVSDRAADRLPEEPERGERRPAVEAGLEPLHPARAIEATRVELDVHPLARFLAPEAAVVALLRHAIAGGALAPGGGDEERHLAAAEAAVASSRRARRVGSGGCARGATRSGSETSRARTRTSTTRRSSSRSPRRSR